MAWWTPKLAEVTSSKAVAEDDDSDAVIDLTSDTEAPSSRLSGPGAAASSAGASSGINGVEVLSSWVVNLVCVYRRISR